VCSVKGRKFTLSHKVKGHILGISVLYDAFVVVLLFALLVTCLVKSVFCRYFSKFLVTTRSAEMTRGYIDTLLSFQIFLISGIRFSYFVIIIIIINFIIIIMTMVGKQTGCECLHWKEVTRWLIVASRA